MKRVLCRQKLKEPSEVPLVHLTPACLCPATTNETLITSLLNYSTMVLTHLLASASPHCNPMDICCQSNVPLGLQLYSAPSTHVTDTFCSQNFIIPYVAFGGPLWLYL